MPRPAPRAFFASAWSPRHGGLVLHGGQDSGGRVLRDLLLVSPDDGRVSSLDADADGADAPGLSHHCGALLHDGRHLVLVGGWTGRKRAHGVHVLDLDRRRWLPPLRLAAGSAPPPVGLSSHTCTPIGGGDDALVVIGREGGVREQRRFGDVFLLRVNLDAATYSYREFPFKVDSRSGHTAAALSSSPSLFCFGGRQSEPLQLVAVPEDIGARGFPARCQEPSRLARRLAEAMAPIAPPMHGLRFHAMVRIEGGLGDGDDDAFAIYGGQHFGARQNVSGRLLVCRVNSVRRGRVDWYEVPLEEGVGPGRFGHALVVAGQKVLAVGGFSSPDGGNRKGIEFVAELKF